MIKEDFILRHFEVCSSKNTRVSASGKRHGGEKKKCAIHLWDNCIRLGIDPENISSHKDLKAKL